MLIYESGCVRYLSSQQIKLSLVAAYTISSVYLIEVEIKGRFIPKSTISKQCIYEKIRAWLQKNVRKC